MNQVSSKTVGSNMYVYTSIVGAFRAGSFSVFRSHIINEHDRRMSSVREEIHIRCKIVSSNLSYLWYILKHAFSLWWFIELLAEKAILAAWCC